MDRADSQDSDPPASAGRTPAFAANREGAGRSTSRAFGWTGRLLTGIAVLFLAFDAGMKVLALPAAVNGTTQLGYPGDIVVGIGVLQLVCLAVYLIPRSALIGAVLWTGYLGGAVAAHVRLGNPFWTHTLFPVYVAVLLWAGLWLRDRRVDALLARSSPRSRKFNPQ